MAFGRSLKTGDNKVDRALQDVYRKLDILDNDNNELRKRLQGQSSTVIPTSAGSSVAQYDITAIDVQNLKVSMKGYKNSDASAWGKYALTITEDSLVTMGNYSVDSDNIVLEWDSVLGYNNYSLWTRRFYVNWSKFDSIWPTDGYNLPCRYTIARPSREDLKRALEYVIFCRISDKPNTSAGNSPMFVSTKIMPITYDETLGLNQEWVLLDRLPIPSSDQWDGKIVDFTEQYQIPVNKLPLGKYVTFWVGINIPSAFEKELTLQQTLDYSLFNTPGYPELYPRFTDSWFPVSTFGSLYIKRHGSTKFTSDIISEGDKGAANNEGIGQGEGYGFTAVDNPDYTSTRAKLFELEVDNLRVRNRFAVRDLVFQTIKATNGSVLVATTGKVKFLQKK